MRGSFDLSDLSYMHKMLTKASKVLEKRMRNDNLRVTLADALRLVKMETELQGAKPRKARGSEFLGLLQDVGMRCLKSNSFL